MRYRDLPKAISWLSEAFGFEVHYTASDEDGSLIYAQMTYGHGMVMLGPVRESDFDDLLSQPDEVGGTETQSCYLVVEDIESHFERAKEAGAEIALDVQSDDTGGRAYSCRDCEGHLWNFGTFNPWRSASSPSTALTPIVPRFDAGPVSVTRSAAAVFAGLAVAGVAIGIYTRHSEPQDRISNIRVIEQDAGEQRPGVGLPSAPVRVVSALRKQLQDERTARREAEQRLATTRRALEAERSKSSKAVATTRRVSEELAEARGAEQAALETLERLRAQHRKELRVATASVDDLQQAIDAERTAKEELLKATEAIKYELVLERQLREQAERRATAALGTTKATQKTGAAKSQPKRKALPVPTAQKTETKKSPKVSARTSTDGKTSTGNQKSKAAKIKPQSDKKTEPQKSKVSAIKASDDGKSSAKPDVTPKADTKPEITVEKKASKPRPRRRVVKKKPVQKKKNAAPSSGISKGWPYNTW